MATRSTSILPEGTAGAAGASFAPSVSIRSSSGISNQSSATSAIGTGMYLRASIGTIVESCLRATAGILMTEIRLAENGIESAADFAVTFASRITSESASVIFSGGRFVARPISVLP